MSEKTTGEILFQDIAAQFDEAWNGRNAAKIAAFLTEDADFVFPDGAIFVGKKEIEKFYANRFLNMSPGIRHKLTLKTVRFVSSDTAIVDFRATITDDASPDTPPTLDGRTTWVAITNNDSWITTAVRVMSPK